MTPCTHNEAFRHALDGECVLCAVAHLALRVASLENARAVQHDALKALDTRIGAAPLVIPDGVAVQCAQWRERTEKAEATVAELEHIAEHRLAFAPHPPCCPGCKSSGGMAFDVGSGTWRCQHINCESYKLGQVWYPDDPMDGNPSAQFDANLKYERELSAYASLSAAKAEAAPACPTCSRQGHVEAVCSCGCHALKAERREPSDEECRDLMKRLGVRLMKYPEARYELLRNFVRRFSPPRGPVTWTDLSETQRGSLEDAVVVLKTIGPRISIANHALGELARAFGLDEAAAREGRCVEKKNEKEAA